MIVEELVAQLGWDLTGEEDLRRFKSGMAEAEAGLDRFVSRAVALSAAAAVAVAGGMAALGKAVVSVSAEFEQYQATLETIEGSADKAEKSLNWVANFAKTTPYHVGEVTQAFVRLKAYGLDPIDGSLKAAGDAGSAMGLGLMAGVEAIADAMTGENERLKAFGITASVAGDKVTYTWRENGKELNRTLKKSGVEIVKFLEENFERRFGGAMDRQSRTWNGMLGNLSDGWTNFLLSIGRAGFFNNMEGHLADLMGYIDRLQKNGTLNQWSISISHALEWAADGIAYFAVQIGRHVQTIAELIENHKDTFGTLKTALLALAVYFFPVAAVIGVAALAIDDFLTYLRGGDSVIGDFIDSLSEFLGEDPKKVAEVLGRIADAAARIAATAVGLGLFAGALRKVAGALGLLGTASAAEGLKNLGNAGKSAGKAKGLGGFGLLAAAGIGGYEMQRDIRSGNTLYAQGKALIPGPEDLLAWLYRQAGNALSAGGSTSANQPRVPYGSLARDPSAHGDALANWNANWAKTGPAQAAAAMGTTVNDNRTVQVTVNQTVQQASQAPGAAARATANAVAGQAGGAPRATWHELGEKF